MAIYRLQSAYLPRGWARDILVTVSAEGMISAIDAYASARSSSSVGHIESVDGVVVPGMPNAHSHAFQRAMAGDAEFRLSARDSFWTWRQAMYALANRIGPQQLQIVATQLFIEMLKAGYTSVAEFHYLHRPSGTSQYDGTARYSGSNPLWDAIIGAARVAGIGLTFLPTLYQNSDFGGRPLKSEQSRFFMDTDEFLHAVEAHAGAARRAADSALRIGAAFHSLRAVPLEHLRRAALALRGVDANMPVHIHVAEQNLEVRGCERATGRRPVELLLDQGLLSAHWCLVHATHANAGELSGIAAAGAIVCVSISTEANLGDGSFDAVRFLKMDGRLCVGSDSQCTVSPAEELRWLEYQQRLRRKRRGVLADASESHVGTRLWRDAALNGAQALGQPVGRIAVGCRADWLALDAAHPAMAGAAADAALDRLVFAGAERAIRDVMVGGRWVVKDHRHAADEQLRGEFASVVANLRRG
ncbi:MAG TPA: formimidoylglutamate deiminase [Steroidobacteraceae bacterium]|jgi:formimidoylglutamate deiminase|nr:formimidoylglutamate deiminase [Steroidobacteraceae bacterium]